MADRAKKKAQEEESPSSIPLSQITKENIHLVNFENIEVKLLAVVSNVHQFDMISGYLTRRGWKVEVIGDIKETLKVIASYNPDFVLVSVNIKHHNALHLPELIHKTMKIPTIAFSETTDAFALQQIQRTTAVHKLHGFVSGPMVQRKVRQILQETHGAPPEPSMGQPIVAASVNAKSEDTGPMIFHSEKRQKDHDYYVVKSVGDNKGETSYVAKGPAIHGKTESITQEGMKSKNHGTFIQEREKDGAVRISGASPAPVPTSNLSDGSARKDRILRAAPKSTFEELVDFALQSLRQADAPAVEFLFEYSAVGVISARGQDVEGLLLIGMDGRDNQALLDTSKDLRDLILGQSKHLGYRLQLSQPALYTGDSLSQKVRSLKSFNFECAEPTRNGLVVASYIVKADVWPTSTPVPNTNMAQVPLEHVPEEIPLDYDLFLYLEKNQKFYKLVTKESSLSNDQKTRLEKQTQKVFVESEHVDSYERQAVSYAARKLIKSE